jgi:hypothetical protein
MGTAMRFADSAAEKPGAAFRFRQGREIVGRKNLSLNDGEIDFDRIGPTIVDRRVEEDDIRPLIAQTNSGLLAAIS